MNCRRRVRREFSFAILVLTGALAACSDHTPAAPGKVCQLSSDCENPQSCTYGKCHEACRANGDCPNGGMCVVAPADGGVASELHVCINDNCYMNSQCPDFLICARDLQCRQACAEDKDCAREDDRCVVGGKFGERVCARPMEVDPDGGVLKGDGPFMPPPLDASPAGDAAGEVAAPDAGGAPDGGDAGPADSGVDAPADVAPDGGVDAPADVAPDGGVDAPADVAPDGGVDAPADVPADSGVDAGLGPCGIPELEPNEDRNTATP